MARGDGRVFLRGAAPWIAYFHNGQEQRERALDKKGNPTFDLATTEKYLRRKLDELAAERAGGPAFVTLQNKRLTVHDLIEALKTDFELRGKLSPQNRSYLGKVDADFGKDKAVNLTAEQIDTYIEKRLAAGSAKASINRVTQMLGQAFALAIRRGHLAKAPHIRRLSERGNERQGFFSEQELATVISHLPEDLRDFARFAAATGMRKGECASLAWRDVDGDTITLRGEHSKNGEARTIPLVGELAEIIARRKAARRVEVNGTARMVEFIFHRDGAAVSEFRKSWQSATLAAGLGKMICRKCGREGIDKKCPDCKDASGKHPLCKYRGRIFHDFRRSAVRNMTQAGTPQAVAMKISGHKTASMFQRYNIVATDDLRAALERTQAYRATAAKERVVSIGRG